MRLPRAPRKSAKPDVLLTYDARASDIQRSTALSAGAPSGTVRSFLPLPNTRMVFRARSISSKSNPHNSETRIPVL